MFEELASLFGPSLGSWWHAHAFLGAGLAALGVGGIGSGCYLGALLLGFLGEPDLAQFRPHFEVLRHGRGKRRWWARSGGGGQVRVAPEVADSAFAIPKSVTITRPRVPSSRMLSGLMSRWIIDRA